MTSAQNERSAPAIGQVYRSDDGNGTLLSEIVGIDTAWHLGYVAIMERWNPKSKRKSRTRFTLTFRYLRSPRCGWRPIR